jgi:response regulator RpfG family c-di-GMP phosphodiesterase
MIDQAGGAEPATAIESPPRPWTVLVVDDEPNVLSALRRLLRRTDWRILTAGRGEQALALLDEEPVDAILSDMCMPGMDGARLLERVRLDWPEVARLMLTGQPDLASTIAAINRGCIHRYIAKPWNDEELLLTLRQVADRQRLEAEKASLERLTHRQNKALWTLNTTLEERVHMRTGELAAAGERLKRNYLTSIKSFTALIELRGATQAGHARGVAELARRIVHAMGLDADMSREVPIAALLHDIGHIGLSDTILSRPLNRLDREDLQRFRLHPVLGEQALMACDDMQGVAPLIRAHHERWDGRGFPDGLRGEAIPIGARVLAVADGFEDLRLGHLDGQALSVADARRAAIDARGTRFDPAVVDAFDSLFSTVQAPPPSSLLHLRPFELQPGHELAQDFISAEGVLLLSAGQTLDKDLIGRICAFERKVDVALTLAVQPPRQRSR